ncbi:hypothetical protein [Aquipuribacter sp. MA13-6]|uniref:hypothetical protein n=1 Tax=unclassified Aquipuribacter TaxID=2635084 RepID=UPI003EEC1795
MDSKTTNGTSPARTYEQVLADAIDILTEAARLQPPDGHPIDWAQFVTQALAGAAANVGGVQAVLAGRPGSWEADGVRNLITSTVGHDDQELLSHRTEPLRVDVFVSEILNDLGVWGQYDEAAQELVERGQAVDLANPDQENQLDAIADQEERLEVERDRTWAAYGEALAAHVRDAAARTPGLTVPVEVRVDLDTIRSPCNSAADWGIASDLLQEARAAVPVPTLMTLGGSNPARRLARALPRAAARRP